MTTTAQMLRVNAEGLIYPLGEVESWDAILAAVAEDDGVVEKIHGNLYRVAVAIGGGFDEAYYLVSPA